MVMSIKDLKRDGWRKKLRGVSYIWTHHDVEKAIVQNCFNGIRFNGIQYPTLIDAMEAARGKRLD